MSKSMTVFAIGIEQKGYWTGEFIESNILKAKLYGSQEESKIEKLKLQHIYSGVYIRKLVLSDKGTIQ